GTRVFGGGEIESRRGLAGHSDGDVITHALIDAVLGAAGLGDIGALFLSGEEQYEGISSLLLLEQAYARVREAGYELLNADCILIGEEPRIAPHSAEMRARLAGALGVEAGGSGVGAATTHLLAFAGRGERLAAQ